MIHSFWVPQLGGKRDVVPGRVNRITLTPDRPGEYWGQCAEFCGASHANMRLRVIVEEPAAFDRWVAAQKAPAAGADRRRGRRARTLFARQRVRGLSHDPRRVGRRARPRPHPLRQPRAVRRRALADHARNVAAWIKDPPALKPGSRMPNLGLSDADAKALAVYLIEPQVAMADQHRARSAAPSITRRHGRAGAIGARDHPRAGSPRSITSGSASSTASPPSRSSCSAGSRR